MGIKLKNVNPLLPGESDEVKQYVNVKLLHWCEVCKKEELLTPKEGYEAGWDAAPYMYPIGVLTPRTCPQCTIEKTVWFDVTIQKKSIKDLSDDQKEVIERIMLEPSILLPQ